jgi:hypothetical protein
MRFRVLFALVVIFYFAFFIFRTTVTSDPDFGWHLQFGRLITATQSIPLKDRYSYTMPSYDFIDHEWGMDIFLSEVYDHFGIWPLTIFFSFIGFCTLYIITLGTDKRFISSFLFLVGGTLFDFIGVRPQTISWLFLAILSVILFQNKVWVRFRLFLPLLFLLWANLHGGFAIGLIVLAIFIFGQMLEKRKFNGTDCIVFFTSLVITLCNPYGYHLWIEVSKSAMDPVLRTTIQEWYPAIYFINVAFWVYALISLFLVIRYYKRFTITELVIYSILFISGMASMRNIPVFVIISFYPTMKAVTYLYEEAKKKEYGKDRFMIGHFWFIIICLFLFLPQLGAYTYEIVTSYNGQDFYPNGAIEYLHHHLPEGQIFASYDWGGYLIWKLPEKKVFIDGRMPSWRNPNAPSNESTYAFGEYRNILGGEESFASTSKKYNIDTVLVSANDLKEQQTKMFGITIDKNAVLRYFFHSNMTFIPVIAQIRQMGWKVVYRDKTAVVFEKK